MNTATQEKNIAMVKDIFTAFNRGDMPYLMDKMANNIEWTSNGPRSDFPPFGTWHGKAGAAGFFQAIAASHDFKDFRQINYAANDNQVFVECRYTLAMKKSGKVVTSTAMMLFDIAGGKVTRFVESTDSAALVAAYKG